MKIPHGPARQAGPARGSGDDGGEQYIHKSLPAVTQVLPQVRPAGSDNLAARHQRLWLAAQIHALGVRATVEFVEAARLETRDPGKFDRLLSRFAELDAALLRRLGADRLPPLPPPRLVRRAP